MSHKILTKYILNVKIIIGDKYEKKVLSKID